MLEFLKLDAADRSTAYEQAAAHRHCSPVMVEKDFWVCWALGEVFDSSRANQLIFKGGTSLSKVFGAIDRFSEDIDLCLTPTLIGADEAAFDALTSRGRRDAAIRDMQDKSARYIRDVFAPELESAIRKRLGPAPGAGEWLKFKEDAATRSPTLYFDYPSAQPVGFEYLRRSVKLEFGSLTDLRPVGRHAVKPWLAEDFPAAFKNWRCMVIALELERTFWEKATILHAEYHRPKDQPMPERYARHYADMAALLERADGHTNLNNVALARHVAEWKSRLFARAWARYDLAKRGSLRLAPPESRRETLRKDYAKMHPMYLTEPRSFEELMKRLEEAEHAFNGS